MQSSGSRRRGRVLNRWTIGLRPSMSLPTANQLAVVIRSRPSSSCAVIHPLHGGMQTMCVCRLGQYIQPSIRYVYVGLIHPTPLHPSSTSSSAVSCAIGYIFMSKHFKVGPQQQFIHSSVDGHVYYIIIPILVHLHSIEGSDGTRTAVALIKVGHYYYY